MYLVNDDADRVLKVEYQVCYELYSQGVQQCQSLKKIKIQPSRGIKVNIDNFQIKDNLQTKIHVSKASLANSESTYSGYACTVYFREKSYITNALIFRQLFKGSNKVRCSNAFASH